MSRDFDCLIRRTRPARIKEALLIDRRCPRRAVLLYRKKENIFKLAKFFKLLMSFGLKKKIKACRDRVRRPISVADFRFCLSLNDGKLIINVVTKRKAFNVGRVEATATREVVGQVVVRGRAKNTLRFSLCTTAFFRYLSFFRFY